MEFDDLIAYLDALIDRAQQERFSLLAVTLIGARARATGSRDLFARRAAGPYLKEPVTAGDDDLEGLLGDGRES